ncbi:MAG: type IV toxin-antitoxin system AbiEi family antitoxin [Candidatus Omnitrophica bacterium]|nr:type IV toxin-antitoxin system AbiEi family antitoxin [Candidatus Omnitrophota bacterium]
MDKLKIEQVPDGVVVNRAWLKEKDINSALVDYYLRKGYLERVAYGAYRRPGSPLKWQHLVYSLQVLGFSVHIGGRSALELKGFAHYLPFNKKQRVHLFRENKLPGWLFKTKIDAEFVEHTRKLFKNNENNLGLTTILFGSWDWKINVASPERAILEMMSDVPNKESFHMVDVMMESATTLRPEVINTLLEKCNNIKVKRLFLWFSEKHGHPWFERLELDHVDLGKGKRVVQKGGKLDPKYLITVPNDNNDRQEQPIF